MELTSNVMLEQRQILTHNQMQSLAILAMNSQELNVFLQKEFIENPMLEFAPLPESVNNRVETGNLLKNISYKKMDLTNETNLSNKRKEVIPDDPPDIRECIMTQLYHECRTKDEWNLIDILIDCLDDNGYFTLKPKEVSEFSGFPESLVIKCLKDLKHLEPVGIFSENLSECLLKQLEASGERDEKLFSIVKYHLSDIFKGRANIAARVLGINAQELRMCILKLSMLNPRPGLAFSKSLPEYIVPDVIVDFCDGQWVLELNDKSSGEYKCNGYYLRLMRTSRDSELVNYLNERFERCRFVLSCIEQRKKTLIKIVHEIAEYQKDHFLINKRLKPMSLVDIAIRVGVHPSTVSRTIRGKYIQYFFGTVSIKSLFSSHSTKEHGQQISAERVHELIQEIIASECENNPLSDNEILTKLEVRGVEVSRRTIAKYRNDLAIPNFHQRKYGL